MRRRVLPLLPALLALAACAPASNDESLAGYLVLFGGLVVLALAGLALAFVLYAVTWFGGLATIAGHLLRPSLVTRVAAGLAGAASFLLAFGFGVLMLWGAFRSPRADLSGLTPLLLLVPLGANAAANLLIAVVGDLRPGHRAAASRSS